MEDKIGFLLFGLRDGFQVFSSTKLFKRVISNIDKDRLINYLKLETSFLRPEPDDAIISCVRANLKNSVLYFFIKYNFAIEYNGRNAYYATALILDNIYLESEDIYRLLDFCEKKIAPFIGEDGKVKEFKEQDIVFDFNNFYELEFSDTYPFPFSEKKEVFLINLRESDINNFFNIVYLSEYKDYYTFYTSVQGKVQLKSNNTRIEMADGSQFCIESKLYNNRLRKKNFLPNKEDEKSEFVTSSDDPIAPDNTDKVNERKKENPDKNDILGGYTELIEEFHSLSKSISQHLADFHSKLVLFKERIDEEIPKSRKKKRRRNWFKKFLDEIKKKTSNNVSMIILFLALIIAFMIVSIFFYQFVIKDIVK